MFGITKNKSFVYIFFKKLKNRKKILNLDPFNLLETDYKYLYTYNKKRNYKKSYVSDIYISKYINWLFIYIYIYTAQNALSPTKSKQFKFYNSSGANFHKINFYSKHIFYQTYWYTKLKFTTAA